jgi:hypothetical protein
MALALHALMLSARRAARDRCRRARQHQHHKHEYEFHGHSPLALARTRLGGAAAGRIPSMRDGISIHS